LIVAALVMVNALRGVVPPIVEKATVPPVPPLRVSGFAPLAVVSVILAPAGVPPLFVVSREALPFKVIAPLPIAPALVMREELPELKVVGPKVIPAAAVVALIVPRTVVVLAVLVKPLVNVNVGEVPLCRVTPPVLRKVVAGVIVPPLLKTTPYP
jgi:hypothetical protein